MRDTGNMDILCAILTDQGVHKKVSELVGLQGRADWTTLEANGLLVRRLLEAAAAQHRGQPISDGEALKEIVNESLDFRTVMVRETLEFNEGMARRLKVLGGSPTPSGIRFTLRLEAELGTVLRTPFRIENNRRVATVASFEISPFIGERGGAFVAADVSFDPPQVELKPTQEAKVDLVMAVAEPFVAGEVYVATITVKGLEGVQFLVRLQVAARHRRSARAGRATRAADSERAGSARASRRPAAARKKTAGRTTRRSRG